MLKYWKKNVSEKKKTYHKVMILMVTINFLTRKKLYHIISDVDLIRETVEEMPDKSSEGTDN